MWVGWVTSFYEVKYFEITKCYIVKFYLRSKFSSFSNNSMEIAQGKQNTFEFSLFGTHFQSVLVEIVKGLVQIGLKLQITTC